VSRASVRKIDGALGAALDVMRQICQSAAEAYARLIAVSKRASQPRL